MIEALNFFASEAGQFLYGAHRYLSAARLLRFSDGWAKDAQLLQTPTLHLVAHGTELLLKHRLIESGHSQREIANHYGHDLAKLWNAEANAEVRALVLNCAETAWNVARSSRKYPDDLTDDPRQVLVAAVGVLSQLHSREYNFALRYVCPPNALAPRPAFLVDAFGGAAEHLFLDRR